ncbi:LysR family transcriptional regulator [Rhodoferax aquaticus]|uniref:LysR family transcriptional regulator n=1 Tax=Rhodoferax aquaticus TaxID=2527691 RepID=A0A515EUX9_9BURK|nr:LysR family transcriptional regulator [Rhodoferax aquaticus]QDL56476.1 LysR family transcriptional regulator [Rhodoferax aquaticus]
MNKPLPLNLRTFDLNLLKVFDVVMAERSLTRAAQLLSLTQPAVSNALRRLRDAVDDELLVRKGRGLEPTTRALELWPAVRDALQRLHTCLLPNVFDPATATHTFVLTMADATAAQLMPQLVEVLTAQAPGLSLRVVPLTTRDPRRLLEEGHADLAIGHFPAVIADLTARAQAGGSVPYLHRRLFVGDYVCVMRKGHPLAHEPLTLDRFCGASHMLVSFSGRAFGFIDEALMSMGRSRRVVLTVNQFFTAGKVVTRSDMLTVLPRHFVDVTGFASQMVLRELPLIVPPIQVDALWHQRQDDSHAHTWLRDRVIEIAKEGLSG